MNRHCRLQLWRGVERALSGIGKEISQGLRRAVPSAKRSRSHRFSLAVAGLIVLAIGAGSATKTAAHPAVASRPHVFLMRGLLNIFSLGMDGLAEKIKQHGIRADVYNHTLADMVVARIAHNYRAGDHGPYILIGHSLGADAVMMMAQSLNRQGVPVALVIPFDGTGSYAASKNVGCVLNLTQHAFMRAGVGFHGKLSNVDLSNDASIDHLTIDKSPRLQAYALNAVLRAARLQSCRPTIRGPIVARPKETPTQAPTKQAAPGRRLGVAG